MSLDDYTVETREVGAYTVRVVLDTDPMSPRDWDNVGRFAGCDEWTFSDDPGMTYRDARDAAGGPILALPVRVDDYGSSGIRLYVTDWEDSHGFYYAPLSKVASDGFLNTRELRACLHAELETMAQYLEGSVYGFVVDGPAGEHESCWGFFSIGDAMSEGVAAAECMEGERIARWCELPTWVREQVLAWQEEAA